MSANSGVVRLALQGLEYPVVNHSGHVSADVERHRRLRRKIDSREKPCRLSVELQLPTISRKGVCGHSDILRSKKYNCIRRSAFKKFSRCWGKTVTLHDR